MTKNFYSQFQTYFIQKWYS